jgi:probable rRNA maturation factor
MTGLLQRAAAALNVTGEMAVVFAGDALLRKLNRDFRFKDKPTDVLSFGSQGEDMGLGDVIISVQTAGANARRFSRTLDRELEILVLHGFLHLLGYDHEKRLRGRFLTRPADRGARPSLAKRIAA